MTAEATPNMSCETHRDLQLGSSFGSDCGSNHNSSCKEYTVGQRSRSHSFWSQVKQQDKVRARVASAVASYSDLVGPQRAEGRQTQRGVFLQHDETRLVPVCVVNVV
jgi:hypothetical protein